MKRIRNLDTMDDLDGAPELWREIYAYLSVCKAEFLEYADEEDLSDHDFNFAVLDEEDLPLLKDLGVPEETVAISIRTDGKTLVIYRIVYPSEVLFIPSQLSAQALPFLVHQGAL